MASIPSARAGFLRRLGYYAIGLAVGFVMLGMFQKLRAREHAARQAAEPVQQTPSHAPAVTGASEATPDGPPPAPSAPPE